MNEAMRWLMYELILLNLLAFCFGVLFGINLERLTQYLSKKSIDDDENS